MCGRRRQEQRCHNMAVHRSRILFSKEIGVCYLTLLIYSAHFHQTQRSSAHSAFMSPCFYSLLSCNSPGKKMLSPPFNPLRSGQRSRASEVHRQLPLPLKTPLKPHQTRLQRVTRRVWDSSGNSVLRYLNRCAIHPTRRRLVEVPPSLGLPKGQPLRLQLQ